MTTHMKRLKDDVGRLCEGRWPRMGWDYKHSAWRLRGRTRRCWK